MALSATFTANFASFYDAVEKADIKLKSFGEGADKVGRRLDSLSNQFSGRQVVQEAALMVRAVEEIGGVSKLTEKELARLGGTANEAVAKMRALGMDVPKNLQAIADKTKVASKATTDWVGSLTKLGGAMGIAFSVGAVTNFIGSVFDAASAVKDLSDQWGVSTTFAQKWSMAAKASGVEAETVGKTIQFTTEKLVEQTKEYDALLANIGLSGAALRGMSTEDAYKTIIDGIAGIKDQTLQLDAAAALLGPGYKKMIGAIRDGVLEAADAQIVMSEETIKRLEAAQAAWERFGNRVVIVSGEMLSAVMSDTSAMTQSWGRFFTFMGLALRDSMTGSTMAGNFLAASAAIDQFSGKVAKHTDIQLGSNRTIKTAAQILADLRKQEKGRADDLAASQKIEDNYVRSLAAQQQKLDDLAESWAGGDIVGKANDYTDALAFSIPIQQMTRREQDSINAVMREAIEVYAAAGERAPQAMFEIELATRKMSQATLAASKNLTFFLNQGLSFGAPTMTGLGAAPPPPSMFKGMGEGLAGAMSSSVLKAIQGGGNILQAAGSAVGSYVLDPKQSGIGKAIESGAKKLPSVIGGAIGAAIPFVGAFIGPAVSALAGWMSDNLFGGKGAKANDLRDEAKAKFGDAAGAGLAEFVRTLGDAAGVKEAYARFMTAGTAEDVQSAMDDLSKAATKADDTMKRYGLTVKDLKSPSDQLADATKGLTDDYAALRAIGFGDEAISKGMADGLNAVIRAAVEGGAKIPAALQPVIETLIRSGGLTKELADQMRGLPAKVETPWKEMQAVLDEFKISTADAGAAFNNARLAEQGDTLAQKFNLLSSNGVNLNSVMASMAPSAQAFLDEAMKWGTELPASMRDMLGAMEQAGLLTDENGKAFEDLSRFKFAADPAEQMQLIADSTQDLIDKLDELIEKLGGVGDAAAGLTISPGTATATGAGSVGGFATVSPGAQAAASSGPPQNVTVVVEQDGKESARHLLPYIEGEVRRLKLDFA